MNKIDQYIQAATRENTRKSYQAAVEHFEVTWGGFLPATSEAICRYLVDHAETHAVNTLKQRLAALAQWHIDQGFPDPTKAPMVKKVLKGIKELHPQQEKRAKPLQIDQLKALVQWLDDSHQKAVVKQDRKSQLSTSRNKALVLLGFWRGFRSDELCRLAFENIQVNPGQGLSIFLPRSKGDRSNKGRNYPVPALQSLCPVNAYLDWLNVSQLQSGPVFRRIDRWGNISEQAIHPNSVITLLRKLMGQAGIPDFESYSSHSLRRGFASWANESGWDIATLMEYVGWKDVKSAMRYITRSERFQFGELPNP
ncbi:MAG: site-specific integrase [Aestuariibacter sp.]|nr:site-specific integrase [Aestuariibacter sp.]MCP5017455.1 site-specific integrase [Ketobacter sp.]